MPLCKSEFAAVSVTEQVLLVRVNSFDSIVAWPVFSLQIPNELPRGAIRSALQGAPEGDCLLTASIPTSWGATAIELTSAGFYPIAGELELSISFGSYSDEPAGLPCRLARRNDADRLLPLWWSYIKTHPLIANQHLPLSKDAGAQAWFDAAFAGDRRVYVSFADDENTVMGWASVQEQRDTIMFEHYVDDSYLHTSGKGLLASILQRCKARGFARAEMRLPANRLPDINRAAAIGFRLQAARMLYRWSRSTLL